MFITDRMQHGHVPGPADEHAALVMGNSLQSWKTYYHQEFQGWAMQAAVDSMQVYREAQMQQAATAQPEQQLQHATQPQAQQQLQGPAIPPHIGHAAPLPTSGAKRPRGEEHESSDSEDDLDVCLSDFDAEECSDWEDGRDE
jgi:hypothetical protein